MDFVAGEEGGLDLEYSSLSKMEALVELEGVGKLVEGKKYAWCKCALTQEAGEILKYDQAMQNVCMLESLQIELIVIYCLISRINSSKKLMSS